jgi:hypothetical protein
MKDNYSRFVVIAGSADKQETFVLEGTMSLAEVFAFITDRKLIGKVESIRIHIDESIQKPWLERYFPSTEEANPPECESAGP